MKRTTYIMIGMLISGLAVIVMGVVFLAVTGEKHSDSIISLNGERTEMKLNNVHVVKAFIKRETEEQSRMVLGGEMTVTTTAETGKGTFSYPKSKYLNVSQINDTLFVVLDLAKYGIPERTKNTFFVYMNDFNVQLSADSTLTGITSHLNGVRLKLKDIKTDSMSVCTSGQEVLLDSCRFRSFDISGLGFEFRAVNSKIENYYMNLDNVRSWTFENTEVGTQYLSGSEHHRNELQKGECRRVIWNPLTKDAQLFVVLRDKADITIIP